MKTKLNHELSDRRGPELLTLTLSLLGGTNSEIDLTSVIQTGNGVTLIKETASSFPAFQFNSGHNVIDNALDILPEKLPAAFSIIVKIR